VGCFFASPSPDPPDPPVPSEASEPSEPPDPPDPPVLQRPELAIKLKAPGQALSFAYLFEN